METLNDRLLKKMNFHHDIIKGGEYALKLLPDETRILQSIITHKLLFFDLSIQTTQLSLIDSLDGFNFSYD